jgi:integrase
MSYERMCKREAELQAEVDGWLQAAEAADAAEDGSGPTGAATRCRTGWPTSKRGWPRFAKPRQNWRPRRKPRRRPSSPRVRRLTRSHRANLRRAKMLTRAAKVAGLGSLKVHPHMLRHACGFKLANDGRDTRSLQAYLGHKNIQHTVCYTELAPNRFKDFWED